MNTDPKLKEVLQSWQVKVTLPADFKRGVWRRIAERAEEDRLAWLKNFFAEISQLMVVPRYATVLAAVVVLMGVSLGYMQGNAAWSQLENKYADSINPLSPNHLMANRETRNSG